MRDIENELRPHMNCSLDEYLTRSSMENDTVWGTDVEIFAASSLLKTDIYVHTKVGNNFKWLLFSKRMLNGSLPKNQCAIYIKHVNGVHYDVVLDVMSDSVTGSGIKRKHKEATVEKPKSYKKTVCKKVKIDEHTTSTATIENQCSIKAAYQKIELDEQELQTPNLMQKSKTVNADAKQNMDKFHKSMKYSIYQCSICLEAWPLKVKPKSPASYVCNRCVRDKETPKKFSADNFMIPSPVPRELKGLTQVEEMLIARALPIMRVYVKPGGQRGYSGHCINLPQKITELAQSLPNYPRELPLIVVTMKGKDNTLKDVTVRKTRVEAALKWLCSNNPQYQGLEINMDSLSSLPENGIPSDLKTIIATDSTVNSKTSDDAAPGDIDEIADMDHADKVYTNDTETSSFLPTAQNDQLEVNAITSKLSADKLDWPSVENEPLNEYTTPFLATMAYPTLFPDAKGDPTNPCLNREVSFTNRVQHLLKFSEKIGDNWTYRFASHPRFAYWALNMIQRKRTLQQSSIFLKQNPGESHLTIEQLREMASGNSSSVFMSKLSRYVSNITGSSAYWHKVREELKAIIEHKGVPTIFFTFSSADMHWPELHSLLHHNTINLTSEDRRQAVINNPHIVDWFFTKRLESFLKHWLYDTLGAEWHWYRYEFQARGSIHCHGTAKLKTDPGLCKLAEVALKGFLAKKTLPLEINSRPEIMIDIENGEKAANQICDYVDSIMSTNNPNSPEIDTWIEPTVYP